MQDQANQQQKSTQRPRLRRKESFNNKTSLIRTAGNSFIEIKPPIIEFGGYQVNKPTTLSLKIINKAPTAQRISIVPLVSPFFKLKVDKKGAISTGMHQTIEVEFVSSEYKYYSEMIRINTETENFQIPVHAYPILMRREDLLKIIPKIIDFGAVGIGESESNVYSIQSQVPLSFEFEFVWKNESPKMVIEPSKGVIKGMERMDISVSYSPTQKVTDCAEVYLQINQYNFEPILINILGSGKQNDLKPVNPLRPVSSKVANPLDSSNKSLLQSKRLSTHKQPSKDLAKSLLPSPLPKLSESRRLLSTLKPKPSLNEAPAPSKPNSLNKGREKQFIEHFNQVVTNDKQKEIKFAIYVGDTALTQTQLNDIRQSRIHDKYEYLRELQAECTGRHVLVENRLQPVMDCNNKVMVPTYDISKNDELKQRQRLLDRLNRAASNILMRNRMLKRLRKIQDYIRGGNQETAIDTPGGAKQQAINAALRGIQFRVNEGMFSLNSIKLQFEEGSQVHKQPLQIKPVSEFDDSGPLSLLQPFEPEIMNYEPVAQPTIYINPITKVPTRRQGAEEEYPTRLATVPLPVCPPLLDLYGLSLNQPFYTYILDDPAIKLVENYNPQTENSIDYLWKNTKRIDDELSGWSEGDPEAIRTKFMKGMDCPFVSTSGLVGSDRLYDVGFIKQVEENCPKMLEKPQLDDPLSGEDSDSERSPSVPVPSASEAMRRVEGDNKVLQQRRKRIHNDWSEDLQRMEHNMGQIKRKQLSVIVCLESDINMKTVSDAKRTVVA